jgi:hypothetical protein
MVSILSFSDLGCLNESAAGSLGAGMASFVRAGFPAARGFVITPIVFSDYLKKPEIAAALDMHKSGAESPDDSWRSVKAIFSKTRLGWNHEMEILTAFAELDSIVSIVTTSRYGAAVSPIYGAAGEDVLDGIKHCWLKWLRSNMQKLEDHDMPAVLVKEVLDSEVSVELRKKGLEIRARAVFGLPEGLMDSGISSDIFEFGPEGKLDRMEMRPQLLQFVMKGHGPSKVDIAENFREEEKLSGEMIAGLENVMKFMRENDGISMCGVCFVSSRPVICHASLSSDAGTKPELPQREHSISLLAPVKPIHVTEHAPVVAARLFLHIENMNDMDKLGDSYVDGVIIAGSPFAKQDWKQNIDSITVEAKRRFKSSSIIIELGDTEPQTLARLAEAAESISQAGMQAGMLIPGIRSDAELAKVIRTLKSALPEASKPAIWVRVMYPSNLFFMDALSEISDVLVLDLDSLGRLMLGTDSAKWKHFSIPALEKALEQTFACKTGPIAIISEDMVSTPGLLEFLIRSGTDILCLRPSELQTVRHIVASVEKRMLMEQGK